MSRTPSTPTASSMETATSPVSIRSARLSPIRRYMNGASQVAQRSSRSTKFRRHSDGLRAAGCGCFAAIVGAFVEGNASHDAIGMSSRGMRGCCEKARRCQGRKNEPSDRHPATRIVGTTVAVRHDGDETTQENKRPDTTIPRTRRIPARMRDRLSSSGSIETAPSVRADRPLDDFACGRRFEVTATRTHLLAARLILIAAAF